MVENHVNILRPNPGAEHVDGRGLAAVLNTRTVDQIFRCLSGTVAVSASDLHALPLPPRTSFDEVARILSRKGATDVAEKVEQAVIRAYGLDEADL